MARGSSPGLSRGHRCLAGCFVVFLLFASNGGALGATSPASAEVPVLKAREVRRFPAPDAFQGVAVDARAFYAISDNRITKYDRATGRRSAGRADRSGGITHLNSCTIRNALLFCAHSNYPDRPPRSSVEIFDTATLNHVGRRSLGITPGALTWADWHDGGIWLCFAVYGGFGPQGSGSSTTIAEYDEQWRRRRTWLFPASVLGAFGTMSASGGAWGPGGHLYVMGHDRPELYVLRLPESGSVLLHVATIVTPGPGQAFGWDPIEPGTLYSIDRSRRQVIVARVPPVPMLREENR